MLPASAPLRLRALRIEGRRSVEQIVDAYGIECRAVRDLLVEYFTERAPELDHVSLRSIARNLSPSCSGATWRSTIPASTRCG